MGRLLVRLERPVVVGQQRHDRPLGRGPRGPGRLLDRALRRLVPQVRREPDGPAATSTRERRRAARSATARAGPRLLLGRPSSPVLVGAARRRGSSSALRLRLPARAPRRRRARRRAPPAAPGRAAPRPPGCRGGTGGRPGSGRRSPRATRPGSRRWPAAGSTSRTSYQFGARPVAHCSAPVTGVKSSTSHSPSVLTRVDLDPERHRLLRLQLAVPVGVGVGERAGDQRGGGVGVDRADTGREHLGLARDPGLRDDLLGGGHRLLERRGELGRDHLGRRARGTPAAGRPRAGRGRRSPSAA